METQLIRAQAKTFQQSQSKTQNLITNTSMNCFTEYLNPESSIVLKTLQDDLMNKKLAMTEQMNKFESQKRDTAEMIKGEALVEQLLQNHLHFSLYEIQKRLMTQEDYQTLKKLDQIVVILANSARDSYTTYFSIKEKLKAKKDELANITIFIRELRDQIEHQKTDLQKQTTEAEQKKSEEAELKAE